KRFTTGSIELLSKVADAGDSFIRSAALGGDVNHMRAVFDSDARNLGGVPEQVYVRDVGSGTTSILNRAAGAAGVAGDSESFDPVISADGSAAMFQTDSRNLGDGPPGDFEAT